MNPVNQPKRYQINGRIRYLLMLFVSKAHECRKVLESGAKTVLFYRWYVSDPAKLDSAIAKAEFWTREHGLLGKDYAEMKKIIDILEEEENRQFPENDIITLSTVYHHFSEDERRSLSCLVKDLGQFQCDMSKNPDMKITFMGQTIEHPNALAKCIRDLRDLLDRDMKKGVTEKEYIRGTVYADEGELDVLDAQIRNAVEGASA